MSVLRIDHAGLVGGRHAAIVVTLARREIEAMLRAGIRPRPELGELVNVLQPAADQWATSVSGSAEVESAEVVPSSEHDQPDQLNTAEAADVLDVDPRWVRQLCADGLLDARRNGRGWSIDRTSVLAYAEDRA